MACGPALPSALLVSIVDFRLYDPTIRTEVFPSVKNYIFFWSASNYVPEFGKAWAVDYRDGVTVAFEKSVNFATRCVHD